MALEVAYFNLLRGTTLRSYSGVTDEIAGEKGIFSKDYSYIEFGVELAKKDNKFTKGGEAGEVLTITANCGQIRPHKYKVKIAVVPELYEYGIVSTPDLYEEGYLGPVKVKILLTKDLELKELKSLVRLYITT